MKLAIDSACHFIVLKQKLLLKKAAYLVYTNQNQLLNHKI